MKYNLNVFLILISVHPLFQETAYSGSKGRVLGVPFITLNDEIPKGFNNTIVTHHKGISGMVLKPIPINSHRVIGGTMVIMVQVC